MSGNEKNVRQIFVIYFIEVDFFCSRMFSPFNEISLRSVVNKQLER